MTDQFSYWRDALAGKPIDTEPGNPRSGYYRSQTGDEVVGIWRSSDGVLNCERQKFNGARMQPDEIDELFGWICRYPIPYALYRSAREGVPIPDEYKTRLTLDEIKQGVVWRPALGRAKLGIPDEVPENPRAVAGHNEPPADFSTDQKLDKELGLLSLAVTAFVKSLPDGKPETKEQADIIANYATRFGELSKSATDQHRIEKEPHLTAGRECDAKWFGLRDRAAKLRARCLEIANIWIDAEIKRRADEARKATELAQQAARQTGEVVTDIAPVEPERVKIGNTRTVSQRSRAVYVISDLNAFVAYLMAMETKPPEFIETCNKLAQRLGAANVNPPGVRKEDRRSAA